MQIKQNYEKIINLRDLFFELLYKWRSLIIAAIIGALLLTAHQYLSIQATHNRGELTNEERQHEINLQVYQDSIKNAQTMIRTYNKLIKEKDDYMNESIYMSLDSQNEWIASKRYFIRLDQSVLDALSGVSQTDPAGQVALAYVSTLTTQLDAEEMEALLGTSKQEYIDELVKIEPDESANSFTVSVLGLDADTVSKQLDYFVERLTTVCAPTAQQVYAHTLIPLSEDVVCTTDINLSASQDEINQQVLKWQESLREQRETLNRLQEQGAPAAPGMHLLRYAAIGVILGAVLLACFYVAKYILGSRLMISREMTARFALPVYGEFVHSRARRPGKGLDKLIEKWEFMHEITDPSAVNRTIAALLSEKYGGKRVLLTGTVSDARLNAFADDLKKALNGACAIVAKGGLPVDPGAIACVKDTDAVLLVEEKFASRLSDINRAGQMLLIGDANVAGCIVL